MNEFLPTLKNDNKKENIIQWLGIVLFLLITYLFIYNSNQNAVKNIKEKRLYTIGIISGFSKTRTTRFVEYIYSYSDKTFEGKSSVNINKYSVGDRVLVVYNTNTNVNILLPYFVDDSIKEPYNGWSKPPMINVTDDDIIKYLEEKY